MKVKFLHFFDRKFFILSILLFICLFYTKFANNYLKFISVSVDVTDKTNLDKIKVFRIKLNNSPTLIIKTVREPNVWRIGRSTAKKNMD